MLNCTDFECILHHHPYYAHLYQLHQQNLPPDHEENGKLTISSNPLVYWSMITICHTSMHFLKSDQGSCQSIICLVVQTWSSAYFLRYRIL